MTCAYPYQHYAKAHHLPNVDTIEVEHYNLLAYEIASTTCWLTALLTAPRSTTPRPPTRDALCLYAFTTTPPRLNCHSQRSVKSTPPFWILHSQDAIGPFSQPRTLSARTYLYHLRGANNIHITFAFVVRRFSSRCARICIHFVCALRSRIPPQHLHRLWRTLMDIKRCSADGKEERRSSLVGTPTRTIYTHSILNVDCTVLQSIRFRKRPPPPTRETTQSIVYIRFECSSVILSAARIVYFVENYLLSCVCKS